MDYLERFDNYKRKHCVELSTKDKLRTGYSNKNQLQQGLNIFRKNTSSVVDDAKLMSILYPDVRDKIRMGQKISSGAEQELAIYDDGISDNSLSERSYGFMSDSDSERSTDSPPRSVIAREEEIGMNLQQYIAMYEGGRISFTEFQEAVSDLGSRIEILEEAPTGETRVAEIARRERGPPPTLASPSQPVGTIAVLPRDEEGSYVPPPYVPA